MTPALTKGSSRSSQPVSSRSTLNCAITHQHDNVMIDNDLCNDGPLSDCDETKGPEREAAINSPVKGKRRATNSVSNMLYNLFS